MTRYTATIRHHSISRARVEDVGDTLAAAKRNASAEFGGGFLEHEIVIRDTTLAEPDQIVATRRMADRGWTTR